MAETLADCTCSYFFQDGGREAMIPDTPLLTYPRLKSIGGQVDVYKRGC